MKEVKFNWKIMVIVMILTMGTSFLLSTTMGIAFSLLCLCSVLYWINKYIEAKEEHGKMVK
jgi:hypothetical protein